MNYPSWNSTEKVDNLVGTVDFIFIRIILIVFEFSGLSRETNP